MVGGGRERLIAVHDSEFAGWTPEKTICVVVGEGNTRVLVKGQPYMSWPSGDEACVRLAIVQLYDCGLGTQKELAEAFGVHVNSVQRYITDFAGEGLRGLSREIGKGNALGGDGSASATDPGYRRNYSVAQRVYLSALILRSLGCWWGAPRVRASSRYGGSCTKSGSWGRGKP